MAVVLAMVSGRLTWAAGMGGGGAWMLFTIVGTMFFVAIAADDRCFFTGLFTSLLTGGLILSMVVDLIFIRQQSLNSQDRFLLVLSFVAFVGIPVAFAWLVTVFVRYAGRAA